MQTDVESVARSVNAVERAITTARHDLAHLRACHGCNREQNNVPHETKTFERYIADLETARAHLKGNQNGN